MRTVTNELGIIAMLVECFCKQIPVSVTIREGAMGHYGLVSYYDGVKITLIAGQGKPVDVFYSWIEAVHAGDTKHVEEE